MGHETAPEVEPSKVQAWAIIIAAVITAVVGCLGLVLAALIALGNPFAAEFAKKLFATPAPVVTPDSLTALKPGDESRTGCIDSSMWTPYRGEAHSQDSDGCWQLEDWGLSAQDDGLLLFVEPTSGEQWHGIHTLLPPNADIRFNVSIEQLQTRAALNANVAFGVVNTADFSSGRFLFYHVTSSKSPISVALGEWGRIDDSALQEYTVGTDQQVTFSIDDLVLDIFIDGERVADPIDLSSIDVSQRAFWIGYSLSVNGSLKASISDFSVTQE